jgi:hypothetical protein
MEDVRSGTPSGKCGMADECIGRAINALGLKSNTIRVYYPPPLDDRALVVYWRMDGEDIGERLYYFGEPPSGEDIARSVVWRLITEKMPQRDFIMLARAMWRPGRPFLVAYLLHLWHRFKERGEVRHGR